VPERPYVAVLLDLAPQQRYHTATVTALEHAAAALGADIEPRVLPTDTLDGLEEVANSAAIVVGPGSPYRNPDAATRRFVWRVNMVFRWSALEAVFNMFW